MGFKCITPLLQYSSKGMGRRRGFAIGVSGRSYKKSIAR